MTIDQQLLDAAPVTPEPLDHDALQRQGRRRRTATRTFEASTALGVVAAALVVGIAVTRAPSDVAADSPDVAAPTASSADPSPSASARQLPPADPDIVAEWDGLSHADAVARLQGILDSTPTRPADLTSIEFSEGTNGGKYQSEVRDVPVGSNDFSVYTVNDPEFDPDHGFETPALIPTWTQAAARNALDGLEVSDIFRYDGVAVDQLGRTVLVFGTRTSDQQVHVDPASGYTTGAYFGGVIFGEAPPTPFGVAPSTPPKALLDDTPSPGPGATPTTAGEPTGASTEPTG